MHLHKNNKRMNIYASWRHVIFVLATLVVPFIFLLTFSHFAKIASSKLFLDIGTSFVRLVIAYVIALALAWVFAVLFYRGRRSAIALPIFDVLQSLPSFALLPLAVYFWGASNFTIIFFLVLAIIWPLFFSIISSLKLMKRDWHEAVQLFNVSGWNYVRYFLAPATIPGIITGSVIGMGEGWEAVVATEIIVGVRSGVGDFFGIFANDARVTLFGILGLMVVIFTINKLIWLPMLDWSHHKTEE